jgi:hypothetical protein
MVIIYYATSVSSFILLKLRRELSDRAGVFGSYNGFGRNKDGKLL